MNDHVLLGGLWILFGVFHSILASSVVKKITKQNSPRVYKFYGLFYNVFAVTSFAAIIFFQFSINSFTLFQTTILTGIAGAVLVGAGLLLMAICIKKYFAGLSGLQSFWEEQQLSNELHISGVHRFVRHPLYLGTFVFIWGLLLLFPTVSLLISNIVITGYTLIGIGFEERKLVKMFGANYQSYQRHVPMLIPRWPK